MQTLQMLQAALMSAAPQVTQSEMLGAGPVAGKGGPAAAGASVGNMLQGQMIGGKRVQGGINPVKNEVLLATMGGTEPLSQALLDAQDQYGLDKRTYDQASTQRFSRQSGLGRGEMLYDLFRGKKAFKDMQESRNNLQTEAQDYQIAQQKRILGAEMERRKEYVKNALPQYIANNPNVSHQAAIGFLTEAAKQNMPMEKILPDGPVLPVKEEFLGPGGNKMQRWRNPQNGAIMTGEQWQPFVVAGPTDKTKGSETKWVTSYDEDGNEFQQQYGPPDANGSPQILQTIATGKNIETKPFSAMPEPNRKYGSMVANTTAIIAQALPVLFDEQGNWKGIKAQVPMSEEKAALLAYKNAVLQSIRPESGAAVPPEEVKKANELYLPDWNDSDLIAQSKVQRFATYQKRMYNAMFEGYRDIPENLGYTDYTQPWMDTPVAQVAEEVNVLEEVDAELEAEFQAALERAQQRNQ